VLLGLRPAAWNGVHNTEIQKITKAQTMVEAAWIRTSVLKQAGVTRDRRDLLVRRMMKRTGSVALLRAQWFDKLQSL
jgi:hypothetical protein